jgi:hypothetical protein
MTKDATRLLEDALRLRPEDRAQLAEDVAFITLSDRIAGLAIAHDRRRPAYWTRSQDHSTEPRRMMSL